MVRGVPAGVLRDHTGEDVGRPAGRERHDDADGPIGIALRLGRSDRRERADAKRGDNEAA
jgi:hypothetical protein